MEGGSIIYTNFKEEFEAFKNTKIICNYCQKEIMVIEFWPFPIFFNPAIAEAVEKNMLVCSCDGARKELELKQKIEYHNNEIIKLNKKLQILEEKYNPLPF